MELSLVQTEDLLHELCNRYMALVVVGAHAENVEEETQVVHGPAYMCMGLISQVGLELTASLNHPLDP